MALNIDRDPVTSNWELIVHYSFLKKKKKSANYVATIL